MSDFNRTEEAQEVFVNKKKPKGDIKYKITLSEEQKEAKRLILENQVTVLYGVAGTSKTSVASITALDLFHKKEVERITLIRPMVATEEIGWLPGDMHSKLGQWFIPIMENLYDFYDKKKVETYLSEGFIRILPLQFAQGINLKNEIAIFDEAENATTVQMKMILTRLCEGSKLVITGDLDQIQLKNQKDTGFEKLFGLCDKIDSFACMELKENRRSKIVQDILKYYK